MDSCFYFFAHYSFGFKFPPAILFLCRSSLYSYPTNLFVGICAVNIFFLSEIQPSNNVIGSNIFGITFGGYGSFFLKIKVIYICSFKSQTMAKSLY